jgi:hypothetical protein
VPHPADRPDPDALSKISAELATLLAAVEREPVPERLLAAALALQAALRARRAAATLSPSEASEPGEAAARPAPRPFPE